MNRHKELAPPGDLEWDRQSVIELLSLKFPGLSPRQAATAERCERDFYTFVKCAWNVIEPDRLIDGKHIEQLCVHLQAVSEGHIKRLLVNIPPRHSKSRIVNVFWPAWEWLRRPQLRYLCLSYDATLTTRDSVHCRDLLDSAWYQKRWGGRFNWKRDQNAKTRYENDRGGVRISSSIRGLGVGEGGDRFLFDDPHNTEKALSPADREFVIRWYTQTFGLRDFANTARVLIMQRLHEEDLTGYILDKEGDRWVHLCLPMEFEPARKSVTPFGGDWRTEAGEPLWPERYVMHPSGIKGFLAEAKRDLGPYGYAAQGQQLPVPAAGGIYAQSWFAKNRFRLMPNYLEAGEPFWFTSWDLATKGEITSSWCVGGLWAHFPKVQAYYLCDLTRFQAEYPVQEASVVDFAAKHPQCMAHVIEDKSNGPAIVAALNRVVPGLVTWSPGQADKAARWRAVAPRWQAGDVWIPAIAPWIDDFIKEMCAAPRGSTNDQLDMQAQAILWNESRDKVLPSERKILMGRPGFGGLRLPPFR